MYYFSIVLVVMFWLDWECFCRGVYWFSVSWWCCLICVGCVGWGIGLLLVCLLFWLCCFGWSCWMLCVLLCYRCLVCLFWCSYWFECWLVVGRGFLWSWYYCMLGCRMRSFVLCCFGFWWGSVLGNVSWYGLCYRVCYRCYCWCRVCCCGVFWFWWLVSCIWCRVYGWVCIIVWMSRRLVVIWWCGGLRWSSFWVVVVLCLDRLMGSCCWYWWCLWWLWCWWLLCVCVWVFECKWMVLLFGCWCGSICLDCLLFGGWFGVVVLYWWGWCWILMWGWVLNIWMRCVVVCRVWDFWLGYWLCWWWLWWFCWVFFVYWGWRCVCCGFCKFWWWWMVFLLGVWSIVWFWVELYGLGVFWW